MSLAAPSFKGNTILANHPIPAGIECFYYEIEIKRDVGDEQNPYVLKCIMLCWALG